MTETSKIRLIKDSFYQETKKSQVNSGFYFQRSRHREFEMIGYNITIMNFKIRLIKRVLIKKPRSSVVSDFFFFFVKRAFLVSDFSFQRGRESWK